MTDEEFVSQMTASQRDLRAFILGLLAHQGDTDDVMQEVNLALWRKREKYNPEHDFLRWAFGFAALEVRSFRSKAAKGRVRFSDSTAELLAEEWPRIETFVEDSRHWLADCIGRLSDLERSVLEAKYGKQMTVKQISTEIDKPLRTAYKLISRALESLRECVRRKRLQSEH